MPIIFHEILYFKRPTTTISYSDIPNESPDISRLLNGQKPFPSANTSIQKAPKKIIVDLVIRNGLKPTEQSAFDKRIQELQSEGFLVYYYHNNRLSDYDAGTIDKLIELAPCPIESQLSQLLTIPVDEILVLNYQYANLLISGFDASLNDTPSSISSLKTSEQIHSIIINHHCSLSKLDELIAEFPTINYLFFNLHSNEYKQLYDLKPYSNLSALETLTVSLNLSKSDIGSEQLAEILANVEVEVLNLSDALNIKDIPGKIRLSKLKQLKLENSPITSISFAKLVEQSNQLKSLDLSGCPNMSDFFPEALNFPELEELRVSSNHYHDYCIPSACLVNILARTKKLKILNLYIYRNIQSVRMPDGLTFPELEEIDFSAQNTPKPSVTMPVLVDFLSRSRKIKRLNLNLCQQIKGDLPDGLFFSHLKELNIRFSSLSELSITKILTQATGLKKLNMEGVTYDGNMPALYLPQLVTLDLDQSTISKRSLAKLLLNAPNLKYLSLNGCLDIDKLDLKGASFFNLETLILEHSSITGEALYKLLSTAHNLKTLDLRRCKNIDDALPDDLYLPELEKLDLVNSTITNDSLLKLIANSPKLKKLNLFGCNNLDEAEIVRLQRAGLEIELPNQAYEDFYKQSKYGEFSFFSSNDEKATNKSPIDAPTIYSTRSQTNSVDADTRTTEQTLKVERMFMGKPTSPEPRELRYETFDGFSLNQQPGMKEPFILYNRTNELSSSIIIPTTCQIQQPLYDTYSKSAEDHYFCRITLNLTHHWQALPSAFADEELKKFYITPFSDVVITKSLYNNLHYIRLKNSTTTPQTVTFEMLLKRQKPAISFQNLPENIRDLAKFCRGFRTEALKNIEKNASAQAFLNALITERTGSCRHRSIVFMHLMQQQHPNIPVRLVSNSVHMFVEVYFSDSWVTCDLGGYPAHIEVNERGLPEYKPGEALEPNPAEVYQQTLSDTGDPLAPDFFKKARNLTTLTLKECSQLPLHYDLSMLDTLNVSGSPLTRLQKLLNLAPNIKTLSIKHCTITPEEFNHLDFSRLEHLEQVSLSGRFIPDMQSVTRLMQTAPKAHWIIESDNFSLEEDNEVNGSIDPAAKLQEVERPKPQATPAINIEIRKKPRQLHPRYFANRNRNLNAKKEAFNILKPSGYTTSVRKTLVNAGDAESTRIILQKTASKLSQLHYYIDSPDALVLAGPYIRRDGPLGFIENEAGGPLYDFIMSNSGTPKNIIIDYNAFKLSDFASYNSLLDDPSTLDDIPLPPDVHIIGLLNQNNPDAYQGADFYSRFDAFESILCTEQWSVTQPIPLTNESLTTEIIELCGGEQWEARLIGHWLLKDSRLTFIEGLLLNALKANKSSFSFNHAPVHDSQFVRFLHDLSLHRRVIHQGHDYGPLPDDFNLVLTEGVHIPEKEYLLTISSRGELTPNHSLLNKANLSEFLGRYRLDESTQQLIFQEGLIEQYKNQVLPIYLTSSLSLYAWLKLLETCKQHQTILQLTLAPEINFPKELTIDTNQIINRPRLIPTSSTAFNPAKLPNHPDRIIDISELKPDELLATFKCNGFNATTHQFEFTPIKICPWEALNEGKTVVLNGEWSEELADAVQTIMYVRLQQDNPPGRLIVFCKTPQLFKAFPEIPYSIQVAPTILDEPVDYAHRLEAVEAALNKHPFVLITGATGIGKTHFMSRTWKAAHPNCYYGEKQLVNFLEDKSPHGLISLYINEANLSNKDWSMFEGLFNDPPAIFYNNHYYPITSRHKIIFDGNPINYGGERHTPRLFQHHPYQLHFQPLPQDVLLNLIGLDEVSSAPILKAVMYMATLNPNDTLLTPREIKMMGYLVKTSKEKYPHILPEKLAGYFAYTLCKNHVPRAYQPEFEMHFKVESPFKISDMTRSAFGKKQDYLLNNTNLPAAVALEGHLMVREDRRQTINHQSLEIGLGGLVIEGESGEGKSQLILNQLIAHGYKKDLDFILIPAKSKPNEIKEKLLTSFHEGLIVVIDEMNSLPMPEQLLNALLEGHDLEDNLPKTPGFLLLGTQNPTTYRGRLKTTSPLEHRLQKVILPTSTLLEKNQILAIIGLPSRIAQDMIGEYSKRSDLTFRDVIRKAKKWLKHHQYQPPIQLDITPIKQVGSLCKTVAIANVERYYANKMGYPAIPLWSEQQGILSIRKLVKANGSSQGEILEFEQWRKTFDDLGFASETVDFHENMSHFVASITDNLKQDNLPLIAFPVDRDSGLPNPETNEPEDTEHAAVISGYNWQTDEFTLVHWGKTYAVDATTLFNATHTLVDTRHQEFYTKNPAYTRPKKWDEKKYLPTTDPYHPTIARKSIIPKKGSGFKAKLLIVKAPNKELLLQKRKSSDDSASFKMGL